MNATQVCARCGFPLERSARGVGWCPRCLSRSIAGLADESDCDVAEAAPPARAFGGYELRDEIGRGGMGVVYRARQTALDRLVALKLLLGGVYSSEAMLSRFRVEAEAAAALQHPNIVPVYDYGEWEGRPYYAMELVAGRDLAAACAARPLPARRGAEILSELAGAVHYAHQKGIVHRDLKPSNVLLDESGRTHITDFGLARRLDGADGVTVTGQMLGSPSYTSPEQAAGRHEEIRITSDVYGLGALFYHLLTGRAPFGAATPTETLRLVIDTEPVPPRALNPSLPRDLETICLKCLAKAPAGRYHSAAEVAEDVGRYLSSRPILARPPSLFYRLRRFAERHRAAVAATGIVMVGLAVGLGFALVGFRRAVVQQRAAEVARGQAEQLVGLMTQDLKPLIEQRGAGSPLLKTIEATIRYFDSLPPELRNPKTARAHADALADLARLRSYSFNDKKGSEEALQAALALREEIVRENPGDPEAAAEWMRNLWERPRITGEWNLWHSYDWNASCLRRVQALRVRFPGNARVKQDVAEVAFGVSIIAAETDKPMESLAAATECRGLVEELLAARPDDKSLVDLGGRSLIALSTAYSSVGETAKSAAAAEQAFAYCTSALNMDPANRTLRRSAADAARWLSYRVFSSSPKRGRDAELIAREHFRILSEGDPSDQDLRALYVLSHWMECIYLREVDGDRAAAQRAIREIDTLLCALPEQNAQFDVAQFRSDCHIMLARLAAAGGDLDEARVSLMEAETQFAAQFRRLQAGSPAQRLARIRHLQELEWVAWDMRDWSKLERLAQETTNEIEVGLKEQPTNNELRLRALETGCFRGMSIARAGEQTAKAIEILRGAVNQLRATPWNYSVSDLDEVKRSTELTLLQALKENGQTIEARALGDSMLASLTPAGTGVWWQTEWRARVYVAVADLLGPEEAARRTELLHMAERLLSVPDAEGRITMEGREAKAKLDRMRAALAVSIQPEPTTRDTKYAK